MKIVVTGATGYIGERLTQLASRGDHEVVVASRRRPIAFVTNWLPFELTSATTIDLPPETRAVIHLAANTSSASCQSGKSEVLAARLLLTGAQKAAAKFVFVSSQTARPDAPTSYGRIKWRIEQDVLAAGGWVVQPGQVYGGCERGLFGILVGVVRRWPVLPAFLPPPKVQPIHVDDLAEGLLRIVVRDDIPPGVLRLASPEPVSFTRFLLAIASVRVRRQRWFVPVPVLLVKAIGSALRSFLRKRVGLERLLSLFDLPPLDSASDLQRLELTLRSLQSGMHPSGDDRRRRLIREGRSLLTYVLRQHPGNSLLRRYVRAVEKLRGGSPLELPVLTLRFPITLALLDDRAFALSSVQGAEFARRLDMATALGEATIQGARRFLGLERAFGPFVSLILISRALVAEAVWRVLRPACAPFFQRCMRHTGSQR